MRQWEIDQQEGKVLYDVETGDPLIPDADVYMLASETAEWLECRNEELIVVTPGGDTGQ